MVLAPIATFYSASIAAIPADEWLDLLSLCRASVLVLRRRSEIVDCCPDRFGQDAPIAIVSHLPPQRQLKLRDPIAQAGDMYHRPQGEFNHQ